MPVCYICKTSANCLENKDDDITYHTFPRNKPRMLEDWKRFCGIKHDLPRDKRTYLCSRHFAKEDVLQLHFKVAIRNYAVPCLYPLGYKRGSSQSICNSKQVDLSKSSGTENESQDPPAQNMTPLPKFSEAEKRPNDAITREHAYVQKFSEDETLLQNSSMDIEIVLKPSGSPEPSGVISSEPAYFGTPECIYSADSGSIKKKYKVVTVVKKKPSPTPLKQKNSIRKTITKKIQKTCLKRIQNTVPKGISERFRIEGAQKLLYPIRLCEDSHENNSKLKYLEESVKTHFNKTKKKQENRSELANQIGELISPHYYYNLLEGQLNNDSKSPSGRRWSVDVKKACLALCRRNIVAYKLLRKLMVLPSPRILFELSNSLPSYISLNSMLLCHLRHLLEGMSHYSKICSLLYDEMPLQKGLSFDPRNNYIFGYEDLGSTRKCRFADRALVFMLRGLIDNWKQPVAYYLFHGTVCVDDLHNILVNVIGVLQDVGFNIVAIVNNQSANNEIVLKRLARSTCNWRKPIIRINNREMVVVADPSRVLKATRNALLEHTVTFLANCGQFKHAQWRYLKDALVRDKNSRCKDMGNITEEHVNPKNKKKVKLAAQVLSRTVAHALLIYQLECGEQDAAPLAELIFDINNLFDTFNSSGKCNDSSFYRQPLQDTSPHLEFWNAISEKLSTWIFVDSDGISSCTNFLEPWHRNIDAVSALWKMLKSMGVTSLCTRRLNLDPLENLFGVISQHFAGNSLPTSRQFDSALKSAIVNGIVGVDSNFNCENDEAYVLSDMQNFINNAENEKHRDFHNCSTDESHYLEGHTEVNKVCSWISTMSHDFTKCPGDMRRALFRATCIFQKVPLVKSCQLCFRTVMKCYHVPALDGIAVSCSCSQPKLIVVATLWEMSVTMFSCLQKKGHALNVFEELQNSLQTFNIASLGCSVHKTEFQNLIKEAMCRRVVAEFSWRVSSLLRNTHTNSK